MNHSTVNCGQGTTFVIDGPIVEILKSDQPLARVPLVDLLEFANNHGLVAREAIQVDADGHVM